MTEWSISELLGQDEVWVTRRAGRLEVTRLEDMDSAHLANLRTWLLERSEMMKSSALSYLYGTAAHVQGEMALDCLDADIERLEETDADEWMEDQPLFEAITARMAALLEETHGSET